MIRYYDKNKLKFHFNANQNLAINLLKAKDYFFYRSKDFCSNFHLIIDYYFAD